MLFFVDQKNEINVRKMYDHKQSRILKRLFPEITNDSKVLFRAWHSRETVTRLFRRVEILLELDQNQSSGLVSNGAAGTTTPSGAWRSKGRRRGTCVGGEIIWDIFRGVG